MNTTAQARDRSVGNADPDAVGAMTGWAEAEAEALLKPLPKKWLRTREVADHARWAAAGVRPDDRDLLVASAYLHDIGFADGLVDSGFHPLDGARYLRRQGLGELACLVAHHSGAHIEADHRGLTAELGEFPRPEGAVADALTYSDVTSGPSGESIDSGERFEDIVDPHALDGTVAGSRAEARVEIYGMVARTLRRTTRRRPTAAALVVTPITLGCTTFVRFQGVLDNATAPHAEAVVRAVLNHRPHAVLVDLALLTGMDDSGARTLINASHERVPITLIDPRARDRAVLASVEGDWPPRIVYGIEGVLTPHCVT